MSCFGTPSTLHPRREGYYEFRGVRHLLRNQYVRVHEIVLVVEVSASAGKELAVVTIGRNMKFPMSLFDGEWTEIEIDLEVERTP